MVRWFWVSCVVSALVFLGGCAPSGPKQTKVSGTVTLDGKPLDDGQVVLAHAAGHPPDVFSVKDGKFEGPAKQGKVRVEIRAFRPPAPSPTPLQEESKPGPENYLPPRFNTGTSLTAEVTASGLNPSQFEVQSR